MPKRTNTMPITKARVNLGAVVEKIRTHGGSITLEKGGIPVARITNIDAMEDLQDAYDLMVAREENHKESLVPWDTIRRQYA